MLYFDYSATTPMNPEALAAYTETATRFYGNSSSIHQIGDEASAALDAARRTIADLAGTSANECYFTGSGSEANFLTLTGLAMAQKEKGTHILSTRTEHPSVLQTLKYLETQGFSVSYVPVDSIGRIEVNALKKVIRQDTILATFAHASSELGTIQDLAMLGRLLAKHDILFHSDCVQTFGKLPIPFELLTSFSITAHKIYGPKGIGAVFIKSNQFWRPFLADTTHEHGFRPGTVDVPAAVAFAVAAEAMFQTASLEMKRLSLLRKQFIRTLSANKAFVFEGHPEQRLPFHIGLRCKGIEGQLLMLECSRHGFAISTGSACKVGDSTPPASLLAIGRSPEEAHEFVRITFGRETTEEDVAKLAHFLIRFAKRSVEAK